jgi:hypothetical protein
MRVKSILVSIGVPLLVALIAAFFGMFLPVLAYELFHNDAIEPHNVVWESLFGIGFYVAGFIFHGYLANPWVGLIGQVLWPLIAITMVFFASRAVLRSSYRRCTVWACVFFFSLLICVGHDAANYLSVHGLPLYGNLYATWS